MGCRMRRRRRSTARSTAPSHWWRRRRCARTSTTEPGSSARRWSAGTASPPSSSNGGSNIAPDGSVLSPKLSRPREAHPLTLGVGDEVKRAAAIAVDAGIRACTPESSAILAQGLEGVDAMLSNGGSSQLSTRDFTIGQHGASYNTNASTGKTFDGFNPDGGNAMPRVSPPRAAGFGTAKGSATRGLGLLKPPPPNNRSPANHHQRGGGAKPKPPLSNRRPAPIRPPSSVGSDDDINGIRHQPHAAKSRQQYRAENTGRRADPGHYVASLPDQVTADRQNQKSMVESVHPRPEVQHRRRGCRIGSDQRHHTEHGRAEGHTACRQRPGL